MTNAVKNNLSKGVTLATALSTLTFGMLFTWHHQGLNAATTTATVEANIVTSLNIAVQNGIIFGDLSASAIAGTVSIDTSGSRTATGGTTINSNTSGSSANFEITGDPNGLYDITLPASVVITSAAGNNMTIDNFISTPESNGQLGAGGTQTLSVGARLNAGSFQPFGAYSGVMATTVEYN